MESNFCAQCGAKLPTDTLFCTECGAAQASAFNSAQAQPAPQEAVSPAPEPVLPTPEPILPVPEPAMPVLPPPEPAMPALSPPEYVSPSPAEPILPSPEVIVGKEEIAAAAPIPTAAVSEKDPQSVGQKLLIAVGSALMAVLMFVAVTAGQLEFIAKNALSRESIAAMVNKIDLNELRVPGDVIINGKTVAEIKGENAGEEPSAGDTLSAVIFESIDRYYIDTFKIDSGDIDDLLDSEEVKIFLSSVISDSVEYLTTGEGDGLVINPNEVETFLKQNIDVIEEKTNYKIQQSDIDDIMAELKNVKDDLKWDTILDSASLKPEAARMVFSMWLFIATIALAVILAVLIFIINRRKTAALLYCGFSFGISGLAVLVPSFLIGTVLSAIADMSNLDKGTARTIESALSGIKDTITLTGLAVFGFGAALAVIGILIRSALKKKAEKGATV